MIWILPEAKDRQTQGNLQILVAKMLGDAWRQCGGLQDERKYHETSNVNDQYSEENFWRSSSIKANNLKAWVNATRNLAQGSFSCQFQCRQSLFTSHFEAKLCPFEDFEPATVATQFPDRVLAL